MSMNFRITTNMMMNTYNYNLMSSTNRLNDASLAVQTGRNFSSYAEDPTSATMAWSLRRDLWRNENQITNSEFISSKIQVAWTTAGIIVDSYGLDAKEAIMAGVTETVGTGREALGLMLQQTADSMVNALNAQYGDHYVYSGDDGMTTPFAWNNATGNLEYRGVNINASPGTEDYYKLQAMTNVNEKNYIDIGLGLTYTDEGDVVDSTAFSNSFSGLDLVGWGLDEDGDPQCIVSIVKQIGDLFEACDSTTGEWQNEGDYDKAVQLMDKFEAALSSSISAYVELDVKQTFISANQTRLEDVRDNLNEQITTIEDVDPAAAIMEMSYAQYCYTAALQIGTQILNQSLIDYL